MFKFFSRFFKVDNYLIKVDTFKEILDDSNGITMFNDVRNNQKREGVVWRSMYDQEIGFKAKSPKYLAWWEKKL